MKPMFSIVMTSFNHADYIAEAIDSVTAQTEDDWELVIADDGSSDDSLIIIESKQAECDRIKLITHPGNGHRGLPETMQLGLSVASADLITFLECDDVLSPEYLAQMKTIFADQPKTVFANTGIQLIGDSVGMRRYDNYFQQQKKFFFQISFPADILPLLLRENFIPTFSGVTVRSTALRRCHFDFSYMPWLDRALWIQLCQYGQFYHATDKLTKWRIHPSSFISREGRGYRRNWLKHIKELTVLAAPENRWRQKYFFVKMLIYQFQYSLYLKLKKTKNFSLNAVRKFFSSDSSRKLADFSSIISAKKMGSVSIALAAYNGGRFFEAQLNSLINQSLPPDEIVVSDDSTTDDVQCMVQKYRGCGITIRYVRNPQKLGVDANFAQALRMCSGNIVFLCDQDDVWHLNKIAAIVPYFNTDDRPIAVACNSSITDENGKQTGTTHWETRGFGNLKQALPGYWPEQLTACLKRIPFAGHDMAFNRTFLDLLLPFPPLPGCHDTWIGAMAAAMRCWHIVPEELTDFRRHADSASGSGHRLNLLAQWREARYSIANDSFSWNVHLWQAVLERLPDLPVEISEQIRCRIEHSLKRKKMNCSIIRRLPMILGEICNRNYFRYAHGWKSVIQDMFLR